jgi:hypothetical protein
MSARTRPRRRTPGRGTASILAVLGVLLLGLLRAGPARAEYRAYELEVADLYQCRLEKQQVCKTNRIRTALDPATYVRMHGGEVRMASILLATWMCYGDTSNYREVCPTPPARKPKFNLGEEVVVSLGKHISEGWRGKVEVAYYQASVRSNVYGVRFADRKNVYARYFEKDLRKAAAAAPRSAPPP